MTLYIFQETIMQYKTFSTVFIYYLLTIQALDGQQFIQEDHIHILKKRAILQSVSETFHVSEMTFACNQTQDVITQQEIRRLLNLTQVRLSQRKAWATFRTSVWCDPLKNRTNFVTYYMPIIFHMLSFERELPTKPLTDYASVFDTVNMNGSC